MTQIGDEERLSAAGEHVGRYIEEAIRQRDREQAQYRAQNPGLPVEPFLSWPHRTTFDVPTGRTLKKISRKIGPLAKTRKQLIWRLKNIRYPYGIDRKRRKTLYRHLKSRGLLNVVLADRLVFQISLVWLGQVQLAEQKALKTKRKSELGYPLVFHSKLLFLLCGDLLEIDDVAQKHRVPKRWYSPYRSAALKEILRNAEASYPVGFPQYIPAGKVPLQRVTAWHRLKLFDEIEAAFAANGMTNHQVARHLTALVFSSRSNVEHHKLKPTPGNVKTNVRDVGRKLGEGKNKNLPAQEI